MWAFYLNGAEFTHFYFKTTYQPNIGIKLCNSNKKSDESVFLPIRSLKLDFQDLNGVTLCIRIQ